MSDVTRLIVQVPSGYASTEVASFVAQLDDQSRRLAEATRGLTPADLAWQPAAGMNTIGMLLAHNATVEVWWTGLIPEDLSPDQVRFTEILGVTGDDDGMPLAEGGAPPAALAGKDIAFFDNLLARARAHLKRVAATIPGSDLTRTYRRVRPNGEVREIEMRWALYHMLEHFAGHFGQILLLTHARRALSGGVHTARSRRAAPARKNARAKPAAVRKAAREGKPAKSRGAPVKRTAKKKSARGGGKSAVRARRASARSRSSQRRTSRGR